MSSDMFIEFLEECVVPESSIVNRSETKSMDTVPMETVNLISSTKKNSNREDESINDIKNSQLKHYRGKCAEVFIENGECYVVCEFCDINFKTLEVFLCHIYKRHLIMKDPYHEMFSLQEDQLVLSQTEKEKQKKPKTKNDSINVKVESNSSAKYLIDISGNDYVTNQNVFEVIEEEGSSNNSDSRARSQDYFNPINTFIINSENQNSKLVCLPSSNDNEINFDEFSMNPLQQRTNNLHDEFNITTSIIDEDPTNFESSFCCDICNEIFCNTKDYKKHYEKHQNEWKNYTCPICPKSFGSVFFQENEFNSHMRRHLQQQGQKDFYCQHCNEIFTKQIDLLRHIEANHSSLFLIEEHNSSELFGDTLDSI